MYMKLKKAKVVEVLINNIEYLESLSKSTPTPYAPTSVTCDVCGNRPNVIIQTQFGTFCADHARY